MGLALIVLDGNSKDARFVLQTGLTIGRGGADIIIQDPKISGRHAEILTSSDGGLVLKDLGSSNGTWFGGSRVTEVALSPGTELRIGRTNCKIEEIVEERPQEEVDWRTTVTRLSTEAKKTTTGGNRTLRSFVPAIRVDFLFDTNSHVLGYGPRSIGGGSSDLGFDDPTGPAVIFQISPNKDGAALFSTSHKELVTLNGKNIDSAQLKGGELVEYRGRKFRISLIV